MITTLIALSMMSGDGITLKYVAEGTSKQGYRPLQATMTTDPSGIKKAPSGLTSPEYGQIKFGDRKVAFVLDQPAGKAPVLYVDANGNGDLTDDPAVSWTPMKRGDYTTYIGKAKVDLGTGIPSSIGVYRFDPADPARAALKDKLFYYADFGYEATVTLGGKTYTSQIAGTPDENTTLWIDRNGDGKQSYNYEMVRVGKPFNYTGTTYVLHANDGKLTLEKSDVKVAMEPMPPSFAVGQKAIPFSMKATDGSTINFPQDFRGKIVLVDFWATWCGPCMQELPNVLKAYADNHGKGFEIVGVSFDQANQADKVASVTASKGMTWKQIYEGKFWSTELGKKYDVSAIPFAVLVDGDTGTILGAGEDLRGPEFTTLISGQLAKKANHGK